VEDAGVWQQTRQPAQGITAIKHQSEALEPLNHEPELLWHIPFALAEVCQSGLQILTSQVKLQHQALYNCLSLV
jgi:hypothetical protein